MQRSSAAAADRAAREDREDSEDMEDRAAMAEIIREAGLGSRRDA